MGERTYREALSDRLARLMPAMIGQEIEVDPDVLALGAAEEQRQADKYAAELAAEHARSVAADQALAEYWRSLPPVPDELDW